jgi:hypothetical protein
MNPTLKKKLERMHRDLKEMRSEFKTLSKDLTDLEEKYDSTSVLRSFVNVDDYLSILLKD